MYAAQRLVERSLRPRHIDGRRLHFGCVVQHLCERLVPRDRENLLLAFLDRLDGRLAAETRDDHVTVPLHR
jgi:hypothetical protein